MENYIIKTVLNEPEFDQDMKKISIDDDWRFCEGDPAIDYMHSAYTKSGGYHCAENEPKEETGTVLFPE